MTYVQISTYLWKHVSVSRGVVPGCAHPDFGRSINPISTRGTDYAHLITTGTPGFSDLPTALLTVDTMYKSITPKS